MSALNILRKTCSLICIILLIVVTGFLIWPIGIVIGLLTFSWVGPVVNFFIGYYVGSREWFVDLIDAIWDFKY